jgi:uncharacterized protein (TIGR00303 family)
MVECRAAGAPVGLMRSPVVFAASRAGGEAFVERVRGKRAAFACVLAHTETCLIPGLSAAGVSEELRPFTPAADAEVVLLGAPQCLPHLPSNPLGPPGPSGITRAALQFAALDAQFLGIGLRVWPATPCERVSDAPGADIRSGRAVPRALELFHAGKAIGERLAEGAPYVVIGESVPGGTTTALSLLLALGQTATGRVSGSVPGNAHELKTRVACAALEAARLAPGDGRRDPLGAAAAVGDPMQPMVAGMALAAAERCDVLLAGGSQMLAVAALLQALGGDQALERVAIGTTRWVTEDPAADVPGLASEISSKLAVLAANLDFSHSRHPGLQAYEQSLVKEGVGAGGAAVAALLATEAPVELLESAIDLVYDGLLARLT